MPTASTSIPSTTPRYPLLAWLGRSASTAILIAGTSSALLAQPAATPLPPVHAPGGTLAGPVPDAARRTPRGGAPDGAAEGVAGDLYAYHVGATLVCSDCHSIHFSQQHEYDGPGPVSTTGALGGDWLGPNGPNPYLLKGTSSTELCLECHDGKTFAPDVVTADVNALVDRSAGHFEPVEAPNFRGHNLSWDPESGGSPFGELCGRCHFGGTMATAKVQCVDCHNPHGNASFRNLWWASAPGTEPPLVAYVRPGDLGLARYEAENVAYTAPPAGVNSWREVTNMCIDCHHTFFAPYYSGSTSPYVRHPGINTESGGSYPINRPGANTDPAFWTTGGASFLVPRLKFVVRGAADFAAATVVAPDNQVFCLTCHKAHGSSNPFALRWDYGTPTDTGASGCFQCHNNLLTE